VLTGAFASGAAAFGAWMCAAWMCAAHRELPKRIGHGCLALITVATHKAARLLATDRVTSTVRVPFTRFEGGVGPGEGSAAARGRRVRRAVGELVVCPYCLGLWAAAFFAAGFAVAPRPTRWIASVLNRLLRVGRAPHDLHQGREPYVPLSARAHIVGISKTTYVLATPRCLDWRHDLQQTSRNH
jgi:uncharacterized protein DUF1360